MQRSHAGDAGYDAVVARQFNKRFTARPDYVVQVLTTDDVVEAVQHAVDSGTRVVATSGGHCLENFVTDAEVRAIIDVSPMKRVYYDDAMQAIAIESGATVGEALRALHEGWGVVVPFGEYPGIGLGGHVPGGAFGFLCRSLGLAVDYLHAVEVVTVDAGGRAQAVIATRDPSDASHDLWWGLTGAGGGNFGIVTRFWFRDAPRSPERVMTFRAEWPWAEMDAARFARLVTNYGMWAESHAGADSPFASMWGLLELRRQATGAIVVRGMTTSSGGERQIAEHLAALGAGVGAPGKLETASFDWLGFALNPFPDMFGGPPGNVSSKVKDAMLRRRLDDRQIGVAYDWLTRADTDVMGGMLGLMTYGGRVNAVDVHATSSAQRNAILDIACNVGWMDPAEGEKHLAWVRGFYAALFADMGGVPVPNDRNDGAFINHPDTDLLSADWPSIYFHDNYARLQQVKSRWDPRDIFRHALSIRPSDAPADR